MKMAAPLSLCLLILTIASCGLGSPIARSRSSRLRRSDDTDPLQTVVDHLSQQVVQMQAQIQANKNNLDNLQYPVGFTVRTSQADMHGFGVGQLVKFDHVVFNAANSYNPSSGVFTAPKSGTYVFFLQTMRHSSDEQKVFLDIMKNNALLGRTHAGFSPFENGSTLAVTHLNQGDTVTVQVGYGSQFWGELYTTFAGFRVSSQ